MAETFRRHGRHPPMPTGRFPTGRCRWCGDATVQKPSINWHPGCVQPYRVAAFSSDQRSLLRGRDKGVCASCGVEAGEWAADHVKPLWSAPSHMVLADRAAWWGPENLQTLCLACHVAKTSREAVERLAQKSGQAGLFEVTA